MASPGITQSPISQSNDWQYFTIAGYNSPGTIALGGMKGFKRETGWDIKKGKGTQGATLTLKDVPPVKGEITLNLITTADFVAWDLFVANVLTTNVKLQQQQGLGIYHPSFVSIGLTQVVVSHYTAPEEVGGKRKYQVKIELLEWQPPPPASVVSTVANAKPDGSNKGPAPQDPRIGQLQTQIKALQAANKAPAP